MPSTTFSLLSTAFDDGGPIPSRFTCDGANASPDLTWSGAPDGTRALALIVTDPDAGGVRALARIRPDRDAVGRPPGRGVVVARRTAAGHQQLRQARLWRAVSAVRHAPLRVRAPCARSRARARGGTTPRGSRIGDAGPRAGAGDADRDVSAADRRPLSPNRQSSASSSRRPAARQLAVAMSDMTDGQGRLRLTVLGNSTAVPHPESAAAGYLVEWGEHGRPARRRPGRHPVAAGPARPALARGRGHRPHARRSFARPGRAALPLPVGRAGHRSAARSTCRPAARSAWTPSRPGSPSGSASSTTPTTVDEYDPAEPLVIGPLTIRFNRGRHYVPAWGLTVEAPDGARLAYTGDTGPSDSVVEFSTDADLLLIEAALRLPAHDDLERGHLTAEEAIDMATRARARSALLVHYSPARRTELEAPVRRGRVVDPAGRPRAAGDRVARAAPAAIGRAGRSGDRQDRLTRVLRGADAHPGGDGLGDRRQRPAPPGPARAGRRPARRRRRPGGR